MALDEALLETAAIRACAVLRAYEWTHACATFGYGQRHADAAAATPLRPLIRRISGGGVVPHGADWTYSLTFPPDHPWAAMTAAESYQQLHTWLRDALAAMGLPTTLADDCRRPRQGECFAGHERHDLLWRGQKIAGAAQRRNRMGLLIQGSLQPQLSWCRPDWIGAMQSVSSGNWRVMENPPLARARELAQIKYATAAHQQRL